MLDVALFSLFTGTALLLLPDLGRRITDGTSRNGRYVSVRVVAASVGRLRDKSACDRRIFNRISYPRPNVGDRDMVDCLVPWLGDITWTSNRDVAGSAAPFPSIPQSIVRISLFHPRQPRQPAPPVRSLTTRHAIGTRTPHLVHTW